MKISICLCTYNGEKYISDLLDSILAQTRLPNEMIIADDGSTDRTLNIVKSKNFEKIEIKIFQNDIVLKPFRNFEFAILQATGDIIFTADQDDIWNSNKIETHLAKYQGTNSHFLFSNALLINEKNQSIQQSLFEKIGFNARMRSKYQSSPLKYLLHQNIVCGATMSFRKEMLQFIIPFPKGFKLNIGHDGWVALCGAIYYPKNDELIGKKLISYRIHKDQHSGLRASSSTKEINKIEARKNALDLLLKRESIPYKSATEISRFIEFLDIRIKRRNSFLKALFFINWIKYYQRSEIKPIRRWVMDLVRSVPL